MYLTGNLWPISLFPDERFKRPFGFYEFVTSPFSEGPAEPEISYQNRTVCAANNRMEKVA
jgi:hypothetical protein